VAETGYEYLRRERLGVDGHLERVAALNGADVVLLAQALDADGCVSHVMYSRRILEIEYDDRPHRCLADAG